MPSLSWCKSTSVEVSGVALYYSQRKRENEAKSGAYKS